MNRFTLYLFLAVLTFFPSCSSKNLLLSSSRNNCVQRVAAFDLGSGSTKMKVADVNRCSHKVSEILMEASEKVDYAEDLAKSPGVFSDAVMDKGLSTFKTLKEKTEVLMPRPDVYLGVATEAFRKSSNAKQFLTKVQDKTGISISIISQKQEGEFGFLAATSKSNADMDNVVVWDIGGASMQFAFRENGSVTVYRGDTGSVIFKNRVIQEVQGKSGDTPNPMSLEDIAAAVSMARRIALESDPKALSTLQFRVGAKGVKILGIGGVHVFSAQRQVAPKASSYTRHQLAETLDKKSGLTDEQVGGKYANTDVSNLAFVLGYMRVLNIDEVSTVKVDLSDGMLWLAATQRN